MQEARNYYDIESLWLLGPEYDDKCKEMSSTRTLEELMATELEDFIPVEDAAGK